MNWVSMQSQAGTGPGLKQYYEAQTVGYFSAIWRHRRIVFALVAVAFILASAISFVLPNKYTAEAMLKIDLGRESQPQVGQGNQPPGAQMDAGSIIESEARILKSRPIARRVVAALALTDQSASERKPGLLAALMKYVPGQQAEQTEANTSTAAEAEAAILSKNLSVSNDKSAYLINVGYTSKDPVQAAQVANAFVDEYLRSRMEAGVSSAERTGAWLQNQIGETRAALNQADTAVEQYRKQTGLLESGASGTSVPQQELRDLALQISAAGQNRLNAEARLRRAREVFAGGGVPSAQDLVGAPVVQRMLENVEAAKREMSNLALAGPRHPGLLQARANLDAAHERLRGEIDQAIATIESDVKAAAADEATLTVRAKFLKSTVIDAMAHETQLKSLQANASAIRDRLRILKDGYDQAVALTGLNAAAGLVMRAQPVPIPSGPNRPIIIGLTVLGACVAGIGYALMMERRDIGFRSDADMTEETGLRCLGMVPEITSASTDAERRMFDEAVRLVSASIGSPGSAIAPQVVLITSSVPGEGKSQLCMSLAHLLAASGTRSLVIDTTGHPRDEATCASISLNEAVFGDTEGFLALHRSENVVLLANAGRAAGFDVLQHDAFGSFLAQARASFDLVIIEAPPAMLVLDFLPLARLADVTVLTVRWLGTPRKTVLATLRRFQDLSIRVRGLVLTSVDLGEHKHYRFVDQCSHYRQHKTFFDQASR